MAYVSGRVVWLRSPADVLVLHTTGSAVGAGKVTREIVGQIKKSLITLENGYIVGSRGTSVSFEYLRSLYLR